MPNGRDHDRDRTDMPNNNRRQNRCMASQDSIAVMRIAGVTTSIPGVEVDPVGADMEEVEMEPLQIMLVEE